MIEDIVTKNTKDGKTGAGMGLVLSGGGCKGAYQVGVLKALKENGFLDDVTAISGASIGTINAMLYVMDDIDVMYRAWNDIDMLTIFDIDLDTFFTNGLYFSRGELLELVEKYINFDKIKSDRYDIYSAICSVDPGQSEMTAEYRRLGDYDEDNIKKIFLASTALPIIYEAVEIDGRYYRDGGICDNEPIKPLYDAGIRNFIIIGLNNKKIFNADKWPEANFITIYPSRSLGNLFSGTLNCNEREIKFREMLGYKDGLLAIKTKFEKDSTYIKMENILNDNNYNQIMMELRTEDKYKSVESRINSELERFNNIAKKYENI